MSSSLDHKCQRCGSQYHGQVCPFCTITGLDVNALLASEGLTMPQPESSAAPISEQAQALLVDVVSNRTFPVSAPVCRFGRDISNDIVLTGDKSLSRFHFQITFNNGEFFVEDAGSRNGTFLNGSPVTSPRKVLNGDIISAGMSRYRLVGSEDELPKNGDAPPVAVGEAQPNGQAYENNRLTEEAPKVSSYTPLANTLHDEEEEAPAASATGADTGAHEAMPELAAEIQSQAQPNPHMHAQPETFRQPEPEMQAQAQPEPVHYEPQMQFEQQMQPEPQMPPESAETGTGEHRRPGIPQGNHPVADAASSSVESLLPPSKEDELTDTASRFLKLAQNPAEALWPEGVPHELNEQEAARTKANQRQWPDWCHEVSFAELDELREKVKTIEGEIAAKQIQLDELNDALSDAEGMKNRLLATRDSEMVDACAAVFRGLGWHTELNVGSADELVLSSDGTAVAIAKVVCTEAQPKPNVLAHLVSSLSNYWSEHGVEPKGMLVVAFTSDGPLHDRPELGKDLAEYANKKNVCLMSSLQLLAIYRESTLCHADVESIKSILLLASGMLQGYEITATAAAT